MDRVIRIAAVSVEPADVERLRQLVEATRPRLAAVPRWTDAADADVLLIDNDSLYGHMEWVRAHGTGRRVIGLSARAGGDGEVVLRRPFEADGMRAALSHWIEAIGAALTREASVPPVVATPAPIAERAAALPEPPPTPPAAAAAQPKPVVEMPAAAVVGAAPAPEPPAAEPPAHELPLAAYCSSDNLPRASRLVRGDAPAITIDNETGVYFGPPGLKALEPYCREPIARDDWEPLSPMVLEGLRAAGGGLPTARLVWLNALHAGGGQLLGLAGDTRVRLARWPQIEREFPRHFRIATVMMKGFATVDEIAAQSGAQAADVADFANASLVAGHAEIEPTAMPAANPAEAASGGLLGRLGLRGRKG
jgi:hypothetical protein